MFLNQLQTNLQEFYEIETEHKISDFITTNQILKSALIESDGASKETVFFRQEEDTLDIAVFFDETVIRQLHYDLSSNSLLSDNMNNYCYVTEGISHFLYLVYNSEYDRPVTLLEMELQAEIDKFIMLQSLAEETGEFELHEIHKQVFEEIQFRQGLSEDEQARYKDANFFAGKYCRGLMKESGRSVNEKKRQLRRFYRLTLRDKLRLINQLH